MISLSFVGIMSTLVLDFTSIWHPRSYMKQVFEYINYIGHRLTVCIEGNGLFMKENTELYISRAEDLAG